jgi:hypothetical protein
MQDIRMVANCVLHRSACQCQVLYTLRAIFFTLRAYMRAYTGYWLAAADFLWPALPVIFSAVCGTAVVFWGCFSSIARREGQLQPLVVCSPV